MLAVDKPSAASPAQPVRTSPRALTTLNSNDKKAGPKKAWSAVRQQVKEPGEKKLSLLSRMQAVTRDAQAEAQAKTKEPEVVPPVAPPRPPRPSERPLPSPTQ